MRDHSQGGIVTADNLDVIRQRLGRYAREVDNQGKPTANAVAATQALGIFNQGLENLPAGAVLAGDAGAYLRETRLGNQDFMAAQQLRDANNRINAAEKNYEGSIAGRLDNQLKAQFRPILKSEAKQRGLTDEQVAVVDKLNKGSFALPRNQANHNVRSRSRSELAQAFLLDRADLLAHYA
jgi:hypothetical protein